MLHRLSQILTTLGLAGTCAVAAAGHLTVTSYSMSNGATGSFNYRDFSYSVCDNGACDITGAQLTGGTGKLTDGDWPLFDWYAYGQNTPWVGWDANQGLANPLITFNFEPGARIDTVSLWLSNTLDGSVALPSKVVIDGVSYDIAPDYSNDVIREITFSGLNLTGSSHTLQLFQDPGASWLMLGEVYFTGTLDTGPAVPEPTAAALALLALGAGALTTRRKKRAASAAP